MLKISSEDIFKFKTEIGCKDDNLTLPKIKKIVADFFTGQLDWEDISKFGNGKIITEQMTDAEGNELDPDSTVDAALLIEFMLVIRQISRIMIKLKSEFNDMKVEMENIGTLLRFNIQAANVNCGNLFNLLDSNHATLMIN